MVVRTKERVFNRAVLAFAPQVGASNGEGLPVDDFTVAPGQMFWARSVRANENIQFNSFQGVHGSIQERTQGFQNQFRLPAIEVVFYPTPDVMKEVLKSFAGGLTAGVADWTEDITRFYSFLYAEVEDDVAGFKAFRFEDGWIRELEIEVGGFGVATAKALIIAQKVTPFDTDAAALAYVNKPAAFEQFAHRRSDFIKDPSGDNVSLAMSNFRLNMRHGFRHDPFNTEDGFITKMGFLEHTVNFTSRLMDETELIRGDAVAETLKKFRMRLLEPGGKELQIDLNNVQWSPTDLGFDLRDALDFIQDGRVGTTDPDVEDAVRIEIIEP